MLIFQFYLINSLKPEYVIRHFTDNLLADDILVAHDSMRFHLFSLAVPQLNILLSLFSPHSKLNDRV